MNQPLKMKYLKSLHEQYPNVAAAASEVALLNAELHLPKGN